MKQIRRYTGRTWFLYLMLFLLIGYTSSCKKFLDVGAPKTSINQANVYSNDATAIQVVTGIYAELSSSNNLNSIDNGFGSLFLFSGLSADEYVLYNQTNDALKRIYSNSLTDQDGMYWRWLYGYIFTANAAIEGLNESTSLTPSVKQQLMGEAKFIRSFCYFYLVNCYGDVPLALSTDPNINRLLAKTSKAAVYAQIEKDLIDSKHLMNENFLDGTLLKTTLEKVRPTTWAARALLARTYLYEGKYGEAEREADTVISSGKFSTLSDLSKVFLMNSSETIWALQPVYNTSNNGYNSGEGKLLVLPSTGPNTSGDPSYPVYLSDYTVKNFEAGDSRRASWVDSVVVNKIPYRYASKYKAGLQTTSLKEYSIVLRYSEQYLIRAEARIRQGGSKLIDGISDLNYLRSVRRATPTIAVPNPLPNLSTNISQNAAFEAIEHERQAELFAEWGHRWFDLKRTAGFSNPTITRADEVMPTVTIAKGGRWNPNWKLYPIPLGELQKNPNLTGSQNMGY